MRQNSMSPDKVQQELISTTEELGDVDIMRIPPEQGALLTVLWFGTVADQNTRDETARILQRVNNYISADNRVEHVMLPIADGVSIIRKKD